MIQKSEDEQLTNFHWHAKVKTMPKPWHSLQRSMKNQAGLLPAMSVKLTRPTKIAKTGGLYAVADVLTSPVMMGSGMTTILSLMETLFSNQWRRDN